MKPTKPYLQSILFCSLIACSLSCYLFISGVQHEQLNNLNQDAPNEQVEEVIFPDVSAVKNVVEKILKYLPAS